MCKPERPTGAKQRGLPFPHLSWREVQERERLVAIFMSERLNPVSSRDIVRLEDLLRKTPPGYCNYPPGCPTEPGDVA